MQLKKLKIDDLKFNPVQPENRTEERFLKSLYKSIEESGQIEPILVDGDTMTIINGHRRVTCLKKLNESEVWANLINGELSNKNISVVDAFAISNNQKALRSSDFIKIFQGGGNVPGKLANILLRITQELGVRYIDNIGKINISAHSIEKYLRVARSLGYLTRKDKIKFINWIIKHKMSVQVRAMEPLICTLKNKETIKDFKHAVSEDKPLTINTKTLF